MVNYDENNWGLLAAQLESDHKVKTGTGDTSHIVTNLYTS